jgi:hypothetical protein
VLKTKRAVPFYNTALLFTDFQSIKLLRRSLLPACHQDNRSSYKPYGEASWNDTAGTQQSRAFQASKRSCDGKFLPLTIFS